MTTTNTPSRTAADLAATSPLVQLLDRQRISHVGHNNTRPLPDAAIRQLHITGVHTRDDQLLHHTNCEARPDHISHTAVQEPLTNWAGQCHNYCLPKMWGPPHKATDAAVLSRTTDTLLALHTAAEGSINPTAERSTQHLHTMLTCDYLARLPTSNRWFDLATIRRHADSHMQQATALARRDMRHLLISTHQQLATRQKWRTNRPQWTDTTWMHTRTGLQEADNWKFDNALTSREPTGPTPGDLPLLQSDLTYQIAAIAMFADTAVGHTHRGYSHIMLAVPEPVAAAFSTLRRPLLGHLGPAHPDDTRDVAHTALKTWQHSQQRHQPTAGTGRPQRRTTNTTQTDLYNHLQAVRTALTN